MSAAGEAKARRARRRAMAGGADTPAFMPLYSSKEALK